MNAIRMQLLSIVTLLAAAVGTDASEGDPVAVRRADGCFVIESMWNLSIQIINGQQFRSSPLEGVDLFRVATETPSLPFRVGQDARPGVSLDKTLDRRPNEDSASWTDTSRIEDPSSNAIRVRVAGPLIVVDVDGVRIAYVDDDTTAPGLDAARLAEHADLLIVGSSTRPTADDPANSPVAKSIDWRIIVLPTDDLARSMGHTVAVRKPQKDNVNQSRRLVWLDQRPLTLPVEMEQLMTAKETACRDSQQVFSRLSTQQMNFRPSNGTHTPRWNAEHMMGRELLFFSQIYHARDAEIPIIDLNPQQMPPDYVARHPDWTGAEEARQMQRVSSFTSRFAYLLKDLPLDEKAPGSRWTLRGLLRQMDRHYTEHTANVKKKFELPDWPKE